MSHTLLRPAPVPTPVELLRRRGLLAGAVVAGVGVLVSCSAEDQPGDSPTGGGTRTVEHPLGSSEIPTDPKRIICLDAGVSLQTALQAGAPVVGAETLAGDIAVPTYLPEPSEDFTALGFNEQNLEQIASLDPDLIIGSRPRVEENYDNLTAIAPTVAVLNSADNVRWPESARTVSDLLGVSEVTEDQIAEFEEAATAFQDKHAATLSEIKVALVRFASEVRIVTGAVFPSTLLEQLGAQRPESNLPPDETTTYISLSPEEVSRLDDADLILHFSGGGGFTRQTGGLGEEVIAGPLWSRLTAVEAGRAFELDAVTWWDGASAAAAQAGLAELDGILSQL